MAEREQDPAHEFSCQRKPQMSITLPRNFAPPGLDNGNDPRTPDQTFAELKLPPPPHHSTCRLRRSRIRMDNFQARNNALPATLFASDIPVPSSVQKQEEELLVDPDFVLPSIEVHTNLSRPSYTHSATDPTPSDRLKLSTLRDSQLPRTPVAQTKTAPTEYKSHAWDMHRSTSECSFQSDSSFSSSEDTFATRPTSFDGSATSPENELQDPFSPTKVNIIPDTPSRKSKKLRINTFTSKANVTWSIEMDNHLFNVYQIYLADPTVTPFKTVPGSIPPTGVCHRVARRAKETWPRASRIPKPLIQRYKMRNIIETRGVVRDKTPEPSDFLRTDNNDVRGGWPSESATRKRLKQLCKDKFTITAHYQRLRESRSPSPFQDQFLRRPLSRLSRSMSAQDGESSTTYATRELGISLVASGATAPLAQLVTGDSPPTQSASEDWFNTPVTEPADNMVLSTPAGLGIQTEPDKLQVASSIPRLASPFNYSTWNGSSNANGQHRRHISHNHFETMHATGTRLLSPFKLESDLSLNLNKRRAQHNLEDELSPSGSHIEKLNLDLRDLPTPTNLGPEPSTRGELVFTGAGDLNQRRIRVRNRGATMGAMNDREHIERLFTPPTTQMPFEDGIPPVPALPASLMALAMPNVTSRPSGLAPPDNDPAQKRLGSPFELDPNKRSYRALKARHVPSLSDPFISTNTLG
jgi:hypothetical protein